MDELQYLNDSESSKPETVLTGGLTSAKNREAMPPLTCWLQVRCCPLYSWPSSLQSYTTDIQLVRLCVVLQNCLLDSQKPAYIVMHGLDTDFFLFFFVELQEFSVRPFLQTVEVSLNWSFPILCSIDLCPSVWYYPSVCWESILFHCPCRKDIKQHQPQ